MHHGDAATFCTHFGGLMVLSHDGSLEESTLVFSGISMLFVVVLGWCRGSWCGEPWLTAAPKFLRQADG